MLVSLLKLLMRDNFCFIVFSHADTPEKEQILYECLSSIKKIEIGIILSSHVPVSERNQNLCDYFLKNNDNLILLESDIFENSPKKWKETFCVVDYFGEIRTETSVFKKSYQAGVLNLYINSFNLAKNLGFTNAILWEHDYILGENSISFIQKNMEIMLNEGIESISFESVIKIFNSDIVEKEIRCCYPVPSFFNLKKFTSLIPDFSVNNPREYLEITGTMVMEQFIKKIIIDKCRLKIEYPYHEYSNYLSDTISGKIHSQSNYLFMELKSGIYFNGDSSIAVFNNSSRTNLFISFFVYDSLGSTLFSRESGLPPSNWEYFFLPEECTKKFNSAEGCKVMESITEVDTGETSKFEYSIDKNNIKFLSSLKKYSIKNDK